MFNNDYFNIKFYMLPKRYYEEYIVFDEEEYSITSNNIKETLHDEFPKNIIDLLKYLLSITFLKHIYREENNKIILFENISKLYCIIEEYNNNKVNKLVKNIALRYLESFALIYMNKSIQTEILPNKYIEILPNFKLPAISRSRWNNQKKGENGIEKTIIEESYCFIKSYMIDPQIYINKIQLYHNLSFIGILYSYNFCINKRVTKFRDILKNVSSSYFSNNTSKDFVKSRFKIIISDSHKIISIKIFFKYILEQLEKEYDLDYDSNFSYKPNHKISRKFFELVSQYIIPDKDDIEPDSFENIFDITGSSDNFENEVKYLIKILNQEIDNL